jgi:hypothetical protein
MRRILRTPSRLVAHLAVMLVGWPLFTIVAAAAEVQRIPHYSMTWLQALGASAFASGLLGIDFLLVGALCAFASIRLFQIVTPFDYGSTWSALCAEAMSVLLALFCGACFWFPTLLSSAALAPLGYVPAALLFAVLTAFAGALVFALVPRGRRLRVGVALAAIGSVAPVAHMAWNALPRGGRRADVVVLGLDSLSQHDDVRPLRGWVADRGGSWYDRPVTPALVTNAVWASVMMRQPVREHGVFHVFQELPGGRAPLLKAADAAGYHTIGMFSDQLTAAVGAQAGFDEDRSGPVGWRQLILPAVQNGSVFLPLVKPMLPRWWPSAAPPNHAGTYTYDPAREIREVLTAGADGRRTFVMAHLTYVHLTAFPRMVDLSWRERWAVATTIAQRLRDRSFHWQDRDHWADAIPVHQWKPARLQQLLATVVDETGFLDSGGRLIVFSDHGDRARLNFDSFSEERYHRVVLATFGLPARPADVPISLIDLGTLAGLAPLPPAVPAVEFSITTPEVWPQLVASARLGWSGAVTLDKAPLRDALQELRHYRPWPAGRSEIARATLSSTALE